MPKRERGDKKKRQDRESGRAKRKMGNNSQDSESGRGAMPKRKKRKRGDDKGEASSRGHSWTEKGGLFEKGKWTKSESDKLRSAMEEYCRMKKVPLQTLATRSVRRARQKGGSLSTSNRGSEFGALDNAWLDIANMSGLPKRTMMSIYNHGCRIANQYNYKGAWSDAEVQSLRQMVSTHGKKWAKIAEELRREVRGVQQKWRKLAEAERVAGACTKNSSSTTQVNDRNSSKGSSIKNSSSAGCDNDSNGKTGKNQAKRKSSREEQVRLLIECVRKNSNSTTPWPTTGIRWRQVANSFPRLTISTLRERWMTLLANNIAFTPNEDRALLKAVTACNATVSDDVPWTRLRDVKAYRSEYGGSSSPPQRPGNHYRRRFKKLEGKVWLLEKSAWEEKRKKKGKSIDGNAWANHIKRKRSKPWHERVKRVQEYLDALSSSSKSAASTKSGARSSASQPRSSTAI